MGANSEGGNLFYIELQIFKGKTAKRNSIIAPVFFTCMDQILSGQLSRVVGTAFGPFRWKMKLSFWFLPTHKLSVFESIMSFTQFHFCKFYPPKVCCKLSWQQPKQEKVRHWLALGLCIFNDHYSWPICLSLSLF